MGLEDGAPQLEEKVILAGRCISVLRRGRYQVLVLSVPTHSVGLFDTGVLIVMEKVLEIVVERKSKIGVFQLA